MSMLKATRQTPAQAGWVGVGRGEAAHDPASDEANGPRHEQASTGSGLLEAALRRENLQQALKRVRANKGAAGVDGLDIDQTVRHLVIVWPAIRERLLRGTYRPSPVRRVTITERANALGTRIDVTSPADSNRWIDLDAGQHGQFVRKDKAQILQEIARLEAELAEAE